MILKIDILTRVINIVVNRVRPLCFKSVVLSEGAGLVLKPVLLKVIKIKGSERIGLGFCDLESDC